MMKKKKTKILRNLFIFLLLTAAVFGGWHLLDKTEATAPLVSSSINSAEDYQTVNMNRDDVHTGNLILINPEYAYRSAGDPGLVSVFNKKNNAYKVKDKNVLLNEQVIAALNNLMSEFNRVKSVNAVNVISGTRTEEEQRKLLENEIADKGKAVAMMWVAKPGFSEHHSGLAFDLGLYFDNGTSASFDGKGKYAWIADNCWKYGFIVRYPENKESITKISYEPWHLRYVGVPHAFMMKERALCLEEYIDFLRDYRFDEKHLNVSANGLQYEIYFTAKRNVPVPTHSNYEISGNNVDGFIVTIEK